MFNLNNIIKTKIGVVLGALLMCFAISVFVMATTWDDPECDPSVDPGACNTPAPWSDCATIESNCNYVNESGDTMTGVLDINAGGGDALTIKDGGDLKIYNSGNSGSALLYVDTDGELTVDGNLKVINGKGITLDGDTITSWPAGGTSLWEESGSDIYYNTGNVGIGTTSPGAPLEIQDSDSGAANPYFKVYNPSDYSKFYLYSVDGEIYMATTGTVMGTVQDLHIGDPVTQSGLVVAGDLEVSGTIERNGNTVWDAGNDGSGTGLDADTLDGYEAADLMAAGGDDCPNCVLYQSIDIDGDGHTLLDGDCDETCDTCYIGSTEFTLSPDGKDQDCDGEIDEVDNYKIKQCGNSSGDSTWRPVRRSVVITACQSYCSSQGSSYNSIGCLEFQPNATNVAHTLDFADCSRGDINKDYSSDPVACGSYQACYCNVIR